MSENLEWKKKDKLNLSQIIDQISDLTKVVVNRELDEINSKMFALQRMGIIKDKRTMCCLQKRIDEFKKKSKVDVEEMAKKFNVNINKKEDK